MRRVAPGGICGRFAEKAGVEAVRAALDAGIKFFEVAPYYGLCVGVVTRSPAGGGWLGR
jgi:aryl-alcohol dehydrogenase-like predicted oxidoreductase